MGSMNRLETDGEVPSLKLKKPEVSKFQKGLSTKDASGSKKPPEDSF